MFKKILSFLICLFILSLSVSADTSQCFSYDSFLSALSYHLEHEEQTVVYDFDNREITEEFFQTIHQYCDSNQLSDAKKYLYENVKSIRTIVIEDSSTSTFGMNRTKEISGRASFSLRDNPLLEGYLWMDLRATALYDIVDMQFIKVSNATVVDYGVTDYPNWVFDYKNISAHASILPGNTTVKVIGEMDLYGREIMGPRQSSEWDKIWHCTTEIEGSI